MKPHTKTLLAAFAATATLGLLAQPASAAIIVTNTGTAVENGGNASTSDTISSFALNGGNAVVLFFSGDLTTTMTATYGGEAMTIVEGASAGTSSFRHSAIGYIINPTATTADIDVSWGQLFAGRGGRAYIPISLSGVDSAVGSNASDNASSVSLNYTTTEDGGFVAGVGTRNGNVTPSGVGISGNWLDTDLFNEGTGGESFNSRFTYGSVDTAGSYTSAMTTLEQAGAIVAFEAVPEPGSLALLGLGGLLIAGRRRRG